MSRNWFEVDHSGLAEIAKRRVAALREVADAAKALDNAIRSAENRPGRTDYATTTAPALALRAALARLAETEAGR